MSPFNEEPSCRCLSPRVLSRSRYDAHWLRQASDVQNTLEALTTTARSRFPMNDAILFQTSVDMQGMSCRCHQVGILGPPWVLFPFSAIITGRDDTRLPVPSLPAHRFSQPLSRSFVPHDLRVCSTPQALLGLWPSKLDPETIGYPCRTPCSCVVVSSSWLPSHVR